jgi:hypothetical protein
VLPVFVYLNKLVIQTTSSLHSIWTLSIWSRRLDRKYNLMCVLIIAWKTISRSGVLRVSPKSQKISFILFCETIGNCLVDMYLWNQSFCLIDTLLKTFDRQIIFTYFDKKHPSFICSVANNINKWFNYYQVRMTRQMFENVWIYKFKCIGKYFYVNSLKLD